MAFLLQEIRKVINIVVTVCHILRLKMHQNPISAGAVSQTPLVGSLQRAPRLVLRGPILLTWRGGEESVVESQKSLK